MALSGDSSCFLINILSLQQRTGGYVFYDTTSMHDLHFIILSSDYWLEISVAYANYCNYNYDLHTVAFCHRQVMSSLD